MAESLAGLLRGLRAARGLSLAQLAERAQVAGRTLSYWEAGTRQPRLAELESVLAALQAAPAQRTEALTLLAAPRGAQQLRRSPEHIRHTTDLGVLPSGGDLLRAMRHRRGLYLEQVAASLGVSGATVSRWEQGKVVPPSDRLDALLTLVGARASERAALQNGYLFLMAPLRTDALTSSALQERFDAFALSLYGNREDKLNDLYFLSFEAQAWPLAAQDEDGRVLLASICANYAVFLSGFNRMAEAYRYSNRALDLLSHSSAVEAAFDRGSRESLLRAAIIAARAEVYRGIRPAPERGLKMLRSWHSTASLPNFHAWMLSDMAEYHMMQGHWDAALRLRVEACSVAERCKNPDELRLRRLDLAKVELQVGSAEHALSLVTLSALDTPFRRADIELLFAEGLTALEERANAQTWLERAQTDILAYDLTHLRERADTLAMRFDTLTNVLI